jgi:hypothetical protein
MGIAVDGIVGKNTRGKFKSKGYRSGGVNTTEGYHMLHGSPSKPEFVLNYDQMSNMIAGKLPNFVKPYMPNMSSGAGTNNFNLPAINVNITGGSNTDGYSIGQQVGKGFVDNVRKYNGNNSLVKKW